MNNEITQERRKFARKKMFLQCLLKTEKCQNLYVWIKDFSENGMRLAFFRTFHCNKCSKLRNIFHLECDEMEKCDIYNFENLVNIFFKGEISAQIEGKEINRKYILRWYKSLVEFNTLEFGIEFLN